MIAQSMGPGSAMLLQQAALQAPNSSISGLFWRRSTPI
jgi:hypothetical protein